MVLITIGLLLLVVALIYIFMTWNFDHWSKRQVPGPKPQIFTGNYPNLYTNKRHTIYDIDDIYNAYKADYDAVGIFGARAPQLLIISPELAHRVFVTDFKHFHDNEISLMVDEKSDYILANNPFSLVGEAWKQRRGDITPGLTVSHIKTVYPVTNRVCKRLSEYIRKQIRLGHPDGLEAKDLSLCFTSETVTDCVLGLSAESFSEKPTPIMGNIKHLFDQSFSVLAYFLVTSLFPALRKIYKIRFLSLRLENFFIDLMQSAIDARRAQQTSSVQLERTDFLDYIIQLANKRNLNTRQLTAHTMTFLLDGFETTASTLAHLLLLLSRDLERQEKLRAEILKHFDAQKGVLDFEKLTELPYLEACVQETIRMFPPAFTSSKLCTEPLELSNKKGANFVVEKGTTVVVPHYCFMKDEDYFTDAQQFQPERFLEPDAVKRYRERGMYMGFGDGPRICVGMRFALTQIKAATVELLTNFNLKVNPKTRTDNTLDPKYFMTRLIGGIWVNFEERQ